MKLDRNTTPDGRGKYALVKIRLLGEITYADLEMKAGEEDGRNVVLPAEAIDNGQDGQFFVIKYKDRFAEAALRAYAHAVREYSGEFDLDSPECGDLCEYAAEIDHEADAARQYPKQTPT